MHRITVKLCLLVLTLALASLPARAAGERQAIEGLNGLLLETMQQGPSLGFLGRYQKLGQPLVNLFDFRTMTEIGLQRHWDRIPEPDRQAIVTAFTRMSIATFASRFDSFGGERFTVTGERPGPRGLVLVETVIDRPVKGPVGLTYVMRQGELGPEVIDVLADGKFSELARQRAELSAIYARSGTAGLVASLDAKASDLATE